MFEIEISSESIAEINGAVASAKAITQVADDASARLADSVVKRGKTLVKVVHDQRMAVSRKVDAVKKQLIAKEADLTADLNAEIERVSTMCSAYLMAKAQAEEDARRAAEEDAARAALEAQEAAAAEALVTGADIIAPMPVSPEPEQRSKVVAGVSSRTYWTFSVTDPNSVPRAYCSPDLRIIREYMENAKRNGADIRTLNIPGVEFRAEIRI